MAESGGIAIIAILRLRPRASPRRDTRHCRRATATERREKWRDKDGMDLRETRQADVVGERMRAAIGSWLAQVRTRSSPSSVDRRVAINFWRGP